MATVTAASETPVRRPRRLISFHAWDRFGTGLFNVIAWGALLLYILPMSFIVVASFMTAPQFSDTRAPIYPALKQTYLLDGKERIVYNVPTADGVRQLALAKAGRQSSQFIDPQNPDGGLIEWQGSWRTLTPVYRFAPTFDNFTQFFQSLNFPKMLRNTLAMLIIGEIGVLLSSVVIAYGFSRFRLPGGNLLFYLLIATILIPEKITLIPTYFFFVRVLHWEGSWLPLLVPLFFGNAVYIFLLRQNFKSIPKEMEEAAMLDGAGPLKILAYVVLPQSWPVVITAGLLHFFYAWNETRQAALYLSIRLDLAPVSFGVQNFQTLIGGSNVGLLQASALIVSLVPVVILFLSQRVFMRDVVVTGMER